MIFGIIVSDVVVDNENSLRDWLCTREEKRDGNCVGRVIDLRHRGGGSGGEIDEYINLWHEANS